MEVLFYVLLAIYLPEFSEVRALGANWKNGIFEKYLLRLINAHGRIEENTKIQYTYFTTIYCFT